MPGIREEDGRDLRRNIYPIRRNRRDFLWDEETFDGDIGDGTHLLRSDFWDQTFDVRTERLRPRNDPDDYADYTPKDILGKGKVGLGPRDFVRSPERIHEEINELLTKNSWLDASFIEVNVVGDGVHLMGEVEDRRSKWLAEDLAESVLGVKVVINQLKVRKPSLDQHG